MKVTAFRIALGASVLVLSAAAALSNNAPAQTQVASAGSSCTATQAQPSSAQLFAASTTARHTNVIRVRYNAAHAMPAKRTSTVTALASCTAPAKSGTTALD